jgi:5-methylthioadenosine/S-adenosylhomocysteine deaminase
VVLRPYGLVIGGELEIGLELVIEDGAIAAIRPHTGMPDFYVISPAFVNAHSHLEYRGLAGKVAMGDYFGFIRSITELKRGQSLEEVQADCVLAANENRATGVALIGEHSDRPGSAAALEQASIGGMLFQELITFFEREAREDKVRLVKERLAEQALLFSGETALAPHTPYTVDRETLKSFAIRGPFSIHVAESAYENQFFVSGEGPIADFYRRSGFEVNPTGQSVVATLADWGLVREAAQFVHCCDLSAEDIKLLAKAKVRVAHCPRSNVALKCPDAPVREILDSGIEVGLGLDSAASSGPIDMFAEMRSALEVSIHRGKPLEAEEVWQMATNANSLPLTNAPPKWNIYVGSTVPLIEIHVEQPRSTIDLIERGSPASVKWVQKHD